MDWIEDIRKAINYIEDNLMEFTGAKDASDYIHSSNDHFQKIFKIVTGFSVSQYIRNRRLSLAGQDFINSESKVIDVALKYRYETPESFTKAFIRFHGFAPSEACYHKNDLKYFSPLTIQINIKGGFNMSKKLISKIPLRQLISNMEGQNYWFNGCMEFLMDCLGEEREYNYWFFSGVTGDSFLQIYGKDPENMVLCYSHNVTEQAIKKAFDACGYNYDYIQNIDKQSDRTAYDQRIREYIDKNIPVIARVNDAFHSFAIVCGYDDNNFYYILGEDDTPKSYYYDELIFIMNKKPRPSLAEVYKDAIMSIPKLITMPDTKGYSFGKKAFTDWAESFQNGSFDKYTENDKLWSTHTEPSFACWNMHGTYLCILGTNGCAVSFLEKALELNPDMTFINKLIPLYIEQNRIGFETLFQMEDGFTIKPEVIKDKNKMKPISDKIIELSKYSDDIYEIFKNP